jgi:cellulose synthase/poly-beta-1,6-N-acetylglucosamine synthase-like glycosyltransferase
MMTLVVLVAIVLLTPFAAAALYLAALAVSAILPAARRRTRPAPMLRFAILAPAHNEEQALPGLLASLTALDYPRDLVETYVVADTCSDATAAIAGAGGVHVIERASDTEIGKGYALAYGLAHIDPSYDAVVFVDGDCSVSPNLLRAFNERLAAGEEVIQAYYTMKAAGTSATGTLRELALCLVHLVRPLGKARFGGSAGLKGSGMCFSRTAIERAGWSAAGLAEDIEQHIRILRAGMRVDFAREAVVLGEAPESLASAGSQHRRWEAGRISAARQEAAGLLLEGIRQRSLARVDAAVELLIPPISVLAAALLLFLPLGLVLQSNPVVAIDLAGIAALALYLTAGVALLKPRPADLALGVLAMPRYVIWKVALYARALVRRPTTWERSQRDARPGTPPNPLT